MNYRFISIEGNIGAGKTTLASKMSSDFNARLILEEFEDNPFLARFYESPKEYAFPLELFFMAERYHQLKRHQEQDLFQPFIISDYFFVKSKLFAQNNLTEDELQLFNRIFDIMSNSLNLPDLLIYLHCDIGKLQMNIKKRGRDFESNISNNYLQNIQNIYLDYLRKQKLFPTLIINVTEIDFIETDLFYNKIVSLISEEKHTVGTHYIELI